MASGTLRGATVSYGTAVQEEPTGQKNEGGGVQAEGLPPVC